MDRLGVPRTRYLHLLPGVRPHDLDTIDDASLFVVNRVVQLSLSLGRRRVMLQTARCMACLIPSAL